MKTKLQLLLSKTAQQFISIVMILLLVSVITAVNANATLPAIPKGVSVINNGGRALRGPILANCSVDMISLEYDWDLIEPTEGTYNWSASLDTDLNTIYNANPDKSALLRINTMGGCAPTGKTPSWVFDAMQVDCATTIPGLSYSFFDTGDSITRYIPVFWDPTYLAKKKAMISMAGNHITANSQFRTQVKVVIISYASAITEDWYIPHDDTGSPSEVALWLNDPVTGDPPGAGYTTQKMIDAAIHTGDATFTDGSVSGFKLTSVSATFTQADVGAAITGPGYGQGNAITRWLSPTQVIIKRKVRTGTGSTFTINARKDGLIDVGMAAFPNQYIATAVAGNGPDLDASYGGDAGTVLAETVDTMADAAYHPRYIVQRNNVTAIIPTKDLATDAWVILADAASALIPTAGQALGVCYSNSDYRMNGGNNCDHDNPDCDPSHPPCVDECALSDQMILDRSGGRIATYSANYYEIYPFDASNLCLATIHTLLNPDVVCPPCSP